MELLSKIQRQITVALNTGDDPIDQARIRVLFYTMLASAVLSGGLIVVYAYNGVYLQLARIIVIFTVVLFSLYTLVAYRNPRPAAHAVIFLFLMLVWSNVFVIIQAVNIVTVQYVLLAITCSFYLLNARLGMIYSIIVLLPIAIHFALRGTDSIQVVVTPQQASDVVFVTVMLFNFLMMIFISYHFLHAFYYTIDRLKRAQQDEKLLNEKLQSAVSIAEASSRAKSDFLSTMSHELRTPLNSVIGMSYVLLADNPRDDQMDNLKVLHFSAESLLALINDILDFNKLEYGKIELETTPFNAAELIRSMHAGLLNQADEKGLQFDLFLDDPLEDMQIVGDPTRLLQILFNLVGNAIKFTPSGKVSLSVKVSKVQNDQIWLMFEVQDTGIGIPQHKRQIIFEPFTQASSNITREFGGTGLGLAITKQLLNLQGSEILFDSEPGQGTRFYFTIKYQFIKSQKQPANANSTQLPAPDGLSDLRVLVAEDNAMNVLLMKKLFSSWNITADFACNGQEAVTMAENHYYDIVLMDIHMPVMDGYEAAGKIRQVYKDVVRIKIIALTASVANDVHQKVRAAGMDDYISKPFNPPDLKHKLSQVADSRTFSSG